jgi:hypothetical protein
MQIVCPGCGKKISVSIGGRKRLGIPVKNVCDALAGNSTVRQAAEKLGCSRGYIYKVLKEHGVSPKALTEGGVFVKEPGME